MDRAHPPRRCGSTPTYISGNGGADWLTVPILDPPLT
jgi:hypothetical protein